LIVVVVVNHSHNFDDNDDHRWKSPLGIGIGVVEVSTVKGASDRLIKSPSSWASNTVEKLEFRLVS